MTYDLTLHTDTSTWIFIGSVVSVTLFTMIGVAIASKLASIRDQLSLLPDTMKDMTRVILRKDFSFKPKFDENNARLQIGTDNYGPSYAPYDLFRWH